MKHKNKLNYLLLAILLTIFTLPAIANQPCRVKKQDGSGEGMWCSNHHQSGAIRCYANVEYINGGTNKIWGDTCYDSYADCWSSGAGAVEPACSK